ncbi:MAG: hypothetical protein WC802_02940 [Patescibacteria group bacterium]|jgi:hypothetical protein
MRKYLVSILFTLASGSAMAQDATATPAPNWGPVSTATTADPQNGPNVGRATFYGDCAGVTLEPSHTTTRAGTKFATQCADRTIALARIQSDERVELARTSANVTIASVQILPAFTDAQTRSSAVTSAISSGRPVFISGDTFAVGTDVALATAVTSNGRGSSFGAGGYRYGGSGVIADFRGDLYGRTPKTGTIPDTGTLADKPDGVPVTPEEQAKIDAEALGQADLGSSVADVQTAAAKIGATLATPTPAEKP